MVKAIEIELPILLDMQKIIPKFLIDNKNQNVKHTDLLNSLNIVGDFLQKSILGPNNINFPASRSDFLNSIN